MRSHRVLRMGQPDVLLVPMDIAVDANRDGTIKFAGTPAEEGAGKPADKTEEAKPFRFWVNDDRDGEDDGEEKQSGAVDSADNEIKSKRDLEDFARLHLNIGGLHEAIAAGQIKVGLKWKNATGAPAVKIYRAVEGDGDRKYVTDDSAAASQMSQAFKTAKGTVVGTNALVLPADLFAHLAPEDANVYLLFEASGEGKGQLVVTIHKADGSEMGEGPGVWMDLKNVKKMYARAITTPHNLNEPWKEETPYDPNQANWVLNSMNQVFEPAWDEEKKVFVYVNGSNEAEVYSTANAETMFKRLWHQGYKGRLAHFRWDTDVGVGDGTLPAPYNMNEWIAWTYGNSLMNYVDSFPSEFEVNICGHSLGNVVVSSALKRGMSISNYLLMQAAIPAGCYDTNNTLNSYPRFVAAEVNNPSPDGAGSLGYLGYLMDLNVNMINMYNPVDYALTSGPLGAWEYNQEFYKPDNPSLLVRYIYYPDDYANPAQAGRSYVDNLGVLLLREVTTAFESMSFVARSRSKAAGAISTGQTIDENVQLNSTVYGFSDTRPDHGAQFARPIQRLNAFYQKVFDTIE